MKIRDIECLVTAVNMKTKKDGGAYMLISVLDSSSGQVFNIVHKDIEDFSKIQPMKKYKLTMDLVPSKYGLNLSITNIGVECGEF